MVSEDGIAQGGDARRLLDVVHPNNISAPRDGQRLRGEARLQSLGGWQGASLLEERLARRADQDRPPQRAVRPPTCACKSTETEEGRKGPGRPRPPPRGPA